MSPAIEFVDQNGEQFWTDPQGRILRHDPERCQCDPGPEGQHQLDRCVPTVKGTK